MRTVSTWASSGIDGDRTSCNTVIVDSDSASVVSRIISLSPLMVVERMQSPRPDDVEGPGGDDAGSERRKLTLEVDTRNVRTGPLCR